MVNTKKLDATLRRLGFRENLSGTDYLRTAVKMYERGCRLTDDLYPNIGKLNNSTWTRVERAIRHAIHSAFYRADYDAVEEVFGYSISSDSGVPTNHECIATLWRYCSED